MALSEQCIGGRLHDDLGQEVHLPPARAYAITSRSPPPARPLAPWKAGLTESIATNSSRTLSVKSLSISTIIGFHSRASQRSRQTGEPRGVARPKAARTRYGSATWPPV